MNPTWASVTYGVFLCIDCSAVHRSLGVHITFIRSIQLDTSWTWSQLRAMQIGGNANAKSFFEQHNCTTADAHIKYKSRAAQMYREKLHSAALKTLKQSSRLHLDSTHSDHDHDNEPVNQPASDSQHNEFFSEHEKDFPGSANLFTPAVSIANSTNNNGTKLAPAEGNLLGPNIEAALSISPKSAQEISVNHKSTIGVRTTAKKGLGGVKKGGLGAQKVKTNFAEVEEAALQKEKEKNAAPLKEAKTEKEDAKKSAISLNLVYKELSLDEAKRKDQLKNLDAKKQQQVERLGMGGMGGRIVSHSATSDMHSIDQESPTNGSNPYKLDRYMSRGQKDDDFEIVDNIRSLQIKSNPHTFYDAKSIDDFDFKDKNWSKKGYSTNVPQSGDNGSSIVHHGNDDDRGRSRKTYQASDSTGAQEKFGNAKSISSEQYFGGTRDIDFEAKQKLRNFEGSSGISSSDLFGSGSTSGRSASSYYYSAGPDLADIKEGVKQGISKVAGRLSNLANDVMGSMQKK